MQLRFLPSTSAAAALPHYMSLQRAAPIHGNILKPDAILAAVILYLRKHTPLHFAEKDFRKQLLEQLVDGYSARQRESVRPKRRRDAAHALEHTSAQGVCDVRRVRVGDGKHNTRSYWKCSDRDHHFCLPDCYNKHVQALAINTNDDDE